MASSTTSTINLRVNTASAELQDALAFKNTGYNEEMVRLSTTKFANNDEFQDQRIAARDKLRAAEITIAEHTGKK